MNAISVLSDCDDLVIENLDDSALGASQAAAYTYSSNPAEAR